MLSTGWEGVPGQSQAHVAGGQGEREQADHAHQQDDQGLAGDHLGPAQGPGTGSTRGAAGAWAQPLAEQSQHRGHQSDGDEYGEQDGHRGRQAHHGEERDAGDRQRGQRDDHGGAGEDDRAARGGDGPRDRVLDVRFRIGELLAMAGEDEQGVVDAHRQADHEGEHGSGAGHVDEAGDELDAQYADRHAHDRGQQRESGRDQ
ncbi:hypothetical protein QF026_007794 [Streptomyces aurantiacus]|nr:hypothetical protein [Streptomyces aurantiacus]